MMTRERQLYWELDRARGLPSADEVSVWARQLGLEHHYFERTHVTPVKALLGASGPTTAYRAFAEFAAGAAWDSLDERERERAAGLPVELAVGASVPSHYGFLLFR